MGQVSPLITVSCPALTLDATGKAALGWGLTSSLLLLLPISLQLWRPLLLWLGKGKGWVVLTGLLAFAGPFAYEAIKSPCVPFPLKGISIGAMVMAQTLLLHYGQRQANDEQQAAEARLNAIGAEVNSIGAGVNSIGAAIRQQESLLICIADEIAAGEEEESET
jgi:hypothetical protein